MDISASSLPENLRNNELNQNIFALKEKETTALIEQGDGYLVAELTQIHPVQAKSFEEVLPELKKIWREDQQKARLQDLTKQALKQIKLGNIPARLGQLIVARKVTQKGESPLPKAALPNIFMQNIGYENAISTTLSNGVLISVVKHIHVPSVDQAALPDQMEQLSVENAGSLYNGIIEVYAEKLGIKINTDAIQKAFSVYQSE